MSNSNFNITKVTVDPVSQEITNLEINGKAVETGGEAELQEKVYDVDNKLNVSSLFGPKPTPVQVRPSSDYDGISLLTINPNGFTGYPGEGLEIKNNKQLSVGWLSAERIITIPEGEAWTGTITLFPAEEP